MDARVPILPWLERLSSEISDDEVILSEEGEEQESKNARTGAGGGNVEIEEKEEGKREDNDEEEEVAASNRGLPSPRGTMKVAGRGGKRATLVGTEKKMKLLKSSKKQPKNSTEQTTSSREGGESPVRRFSRAKRPSVWFLDTFSSSPSQEEDDLTLRKKTRRVTSAKTDRADVSDVTPTQTTQAASSSSYGEPQNSPVEDENTPSLDIRSHDKRSSRKKRTSGLEVSSAPAPTQAAGSMPSPSDVRPSKSAKLSSSSTPNGKISRTNAAAYQGSSRSAMAEFMSQRQQLMSRVADPDSQDDLQKRQRSLSESDYGLSDLDIPSVDPKPSVSRKTMASETPRNLRYEPGPSLGLLPPLIDGCRTIVDKPNLERKRVFLRAKQLAFEQLKWHRENEFQQRELKLLRREMETREALAKQELVIKRMRIRAAIIQPMISAGASVEDVAERLKML